MLLSALLRRWPLLIVLVSLAAGLSFGATKVVPPVYESDASVVLIPPRSPDNPGGNRYLLLGGLTPARDILIRSLSSDESRSEITGDRRDLDYKLEPDFTTSAPIVVITTEGPDPAASKSLLDELLSRIPQSLISLQEELDTTERSRITALTLSQDVTAERTGKRQIRAVIAIAGLVIVAGVLLIGTLDGILLRRRRLRSGADSPQVGGQSGSPPDSLGITTDGGAGEGPERRVSDKSEGIAGPARTPVKSVRGKAAGKGRLAKGRR